MLFLGYQEGAEASHSERHVRDLFRRPSFWDFWPSIPSVLELAFITTFTKRKQSFKEVKHPVQNSRAHQRKPGLRPRSHLSSNATGMGQQMFLVYGGDVKQGISSHTVQMMETCLIGIYSYESLKLCYGIAQLLSGLVVCVFCYDWSAYFFPHATLH